MPQYSVYLLLGALLCLPANAAPQIELSASQQQWLKAHPQIVWAAETDYQPFIFIDAQGQPRGLSYDLLSLLSSRLGLPLMQAPAGQLQDLLDQVKQGEIDLLTSLRPTAGRAELLAFTSAYIQVPSVLVLPAGADRSTTLEQLNGQRVAVGKGYAVETYARKNYPAVQWQAQASDADSLQALQAGTVKAALMDLGSASYLLSELPVQGLQIGSRVSFDYPLSLAYRKDWPELGNILEAGLHSITPQERNALAKRWLGQLPDSPKLPGSQLLTTIALGLLVAAGLLLLAYQRRRKSSQA